MEIVSLSQVMEEFCEIFGRLDDECVCLPNIGLKLEGKNVIHFFKNVNLYDML